MNHRRFDRELAVCKSDGCNQEIWYKTLEGAFIDPAERRYSGIRSPLNARGSPGPYHRNNPNGGNSYPSQYCKQHTCSYFLRDDACHYKKPPHDAVCAIHSKCPILDCHQAKVQYLEPNSVDPTTPKYARYEFCADHKCTVRHCNRRRARPGTAFCQTHCCPADGCTNQKQEQQNCCEEHTCRNDKCQTIVDEKYPFCALHIKCELRNCGKARHLVPKTKEYLSFCTEHVTCNLPRCKEIKLERSTFCANHTCRERDCAQSAFPRTPYCNDHRCEDEYCPYPKTVSWESSNPKNNNGSSSSFNRSKFCPLHTCRTEKCQGYVDRLAIFCNSHRCSKERCQEESVVEHLCLNHLRSHYIAQGELNVRGGVGRAINPGVPGVPGGGVRPPTLPVKAPSGQPPVARDLRMPVVHKDYESYTEENDDEEEDDEAAADDSQHSGRGDPEEGEPVVIEELPHAPSPAFRGRQPSNGTNGSGNGPPPPEFITLPTMPSRSNPSNSKAQRTANGKKNKKNRINVNTNLGDNMNNMNTNDNHSNSVNSGSKYQAHFDEALPGHESDEGW
ncbi:hypothetical protein QBC46DRAFT_381813 [Diplogelasinospora grovesii]|uniref:Uncharacterized protein n=1 Tax=Diplogelasinospora grovesii TaxID=303347 RepID=A0AAN6S5C2_9PEZI|nr:hypothetical protein QBC46DRAFT_381813 [Diplogelasinospora grovesii]